MDKFDLFLSKMKLMSIAVLVENLPYCSNAFYAYDKDNKTLIFSGHEDSTHIKALFANRFVSGTIALDTKIISRIKGIQFKGKIRSADENEAKITGQRELIGNTCCLSNKPGVQVFMYDLKDDNGSWLARCFLTSDGVYMSYSEWGNFFHYFAAPGKDGIRKFMLGISDGYFANKLCEVEWNTAPTKVVAAAKRHAKYVLPVLQQAIREQLEKEG